MSETSRPVVAVEAHGLSKSFGPIEALQALDLQVPAGAVYALVGPNGAGKTTTFKILLGLVSPDRGGMTVFGRDVVRDGPAVRSGIGYVPEAHDAGYKWLRVRDLLRHHATYYPSWDDAYAQKLLGEFQINPLQRFGNLSKGQARRTQLVMALASRPRLLLLDEPTDGLDPASREHVIGVLAEQLSQFDVTVLVATHLVHVVDTLVDHMGVLTAGRMKAQWDRATLATMLREYQAEIPEGWSPPDELNGSVLRRKGGEREIAWAVWGGEDGVTAKLNASGAQVRSVRPLTLEESAVVMINAGGWTP